MVQVDLLGQYIKYIIQYQPGSAIIKNNVSLACMTMINPDTGWFEISKVPTYDLDNVLVTCGQKTGLCWALLT